MTQTNTHFTANPKTVSVAMATYNGSRFILEQLESIVNQTCKPQEIVICDDCSVDETVALVTSFITKHPDAGITLVRNEKNLGYQKNFEKAIKLCRSEYIALCDQDDIWIPAKLETLLEQIGDNCMIHSDAALIDENNKIIHESFTRIYRKKTLPTFTDLLLCPYITGCTMLFRKDLLKDTTIIPGKIPHDYFLSLLVPSGKIAYCGEPLVLYRQHGGNLIGASHTKRPVTIFKRSWIKDLLFPARYFRKFFKNRKTFLDFVYTALYVDLIPESQAVLDELLLFFDLEKSRGLPRSEFHKLYDKYQSSFRLSRSKRVLFYMISLLGLF